MPIEKLLPRCFPISLGCRFDAMAFQNVRDRRVRHNIAEVCYCTLNASITPRAIFLSDTNDEFRNLSESLRPAWISVCAPIIFPGNQPSMPGQQCLGCDDSRDLRQDFP